MADGVLSKYCVLDGDMFYKVPDSLGYEQVALDRAFVAVAVYAVRQSALKTIAVVFGLGPIGL